MHMSDIGSRLDIIIFISCSTLVCTWYYRFIVKNSAIIENPLLQRYNIIRNGVWSLVETVNYLQQGAGQMYFPWWWKISCGNFVNLLWCPEHLGIQLGNGSDLTFTAAFSGVMSDLKKKKKDWIFPNKHVIFYNGEKPLHWYTYFQKKLFFFFFNLNNKHWFLIVLEA